MGFLKIFKSKTVWGAILMGAFNTLPQVAAVVPPTSGAGKGINIALAAATILSRVFPSQAFGGQSPAPTPQAK